MILNSLRKNSGSNTAGIRWIDRLSVSARSQKVRTILEFAESEITLPMDGGPFQGQKFRSHRQPYVRLLWSEIESRRWSEAFITGCVQSGKTLSAFVVLLLYMVFELRNSPIAAIPDGTMIGDKWNADLEPVLKANTKWNDQLPKTGQGSKGGAPKTSVEFECGQSIKFVTKGGSDQSKAGYTAPYMVVTEAAGWSVGTETSKEAKPIDQLRGRTMSAAKFDEDGNVSSNSMMVVEGTVTDEYDLPVSEKPFTTQSRIACPCPHCEQHVTPEREHLVGWQNAKTELDAAKLAYFKCPSCDERLTPDDRRSMNENSILLHDGQEMVDGQILGEVPAVTKLYIRWNAFNNMFLPPAEYGVIEWSASQLEKGSAEWENAEKRLCQQIWVIPYTARSKQRERVSQKHVRKRRDEFNWGILPKDTEHLVMGVDVGKWDCWWLLLAFRSNGLIHCPAYGRQATNLLTENKQVEEHEVEAIQRCLHGIYKMCHDGWMRTDGEMISPGMVVVDSNYKKGAVFQSMVDEDRDIFYPLLGKGQTNFKPSLFVLPANETKYVYDINNNGHFLKYDVENDRDRLYVDADLAKTEIQNCLRVRKGMPGALTLARSPVDDHKLISRHFCAELKDEDGKWRKTGANHLLDCGGYAWMAGSHLGFDVRNFKSPEEPDKKKLSPFEAMLNGV